MVFGFRPVMVPEVALGEKITLLLFGGVALGDRPLRRRRNSASLT